MKSLESRYGNLWIEQASTPIEALDVNATNVGTVQVCIGVRVHEDRNRSLVRDELLLELDTLAAGELAEKLTAVALNIEKDKAVAGLYNPN